MSSHHVLHESHVARPHFAEKVENFFRTTENVYTNKLGSGLFNGNRLNFVRDTFEMYVEVPNYKPEEVTVTTRDEMIIIAGKREETHPDYGYQSKEFINKYTLPKNIDKSKMTCVFKDRGYLKIEAPFVKPDEPNSRTIPIKIIDDNNNNSPTIQHAASSSTSTATGASKTASTSSVTTNGTSVSHV